MGKHPRLAARGRRHEVDTPKGTVPALVPLGPTERAPRMDPVPAPGEHTRAILAELALGEAEVAELLRDGVV